MKLVDILEMDRRSFLKGLVGTAIAGVPTKSNAWFHSSPVEFTKVSWRHPDAYRRARRELENWLHSPNTDGDIERNSDDEQYSAFLLCSGLPPSTAPIRAISVLRAAELAAEETSRKMMAILYEYPGDNWNPERRQKEKAAEDAWVDALNRILSPIGGAVKTSDEQNDIRKECKKRGAEMFQRALRGQ